jgi:hypothetical protein
LGTVPVILAVSVIWVGCAWALATKAWAAARPEPLLDPDADDDAVVGLAPAEPVVAELPLDVVAVLEDFELLLQAASAAAMATVPNTVNIERRRRFGVFRAPASLGKGPPPSVSLFSSGPDVRVRA